MEINTNTDGQSAKMTNAPIPQDVYSITHDLRAPLMSIKGLIHLLKADLTKEQFTEYLRFLEHSVNKMDDSINRIVDSSKDSIELQMRTQEIDFDKTIKESLRSLHYMAEIELVHITVSVEESEPFFSDPERLLSIFNNIISNAVRYRDRSKNSFLFIDVSFHQGKAILSFTDNGIGIEEVFQHRIFNKLFRVSHDHQGSGLGLYIVLTTVKKLDGEIKVHSVLGEGTTFTIEIPSLFQQNLTVDRD